MNSLTVNSILTYAAGIYYMLTNCESVSVVDSWWITQQLESTIYTNNKLHLRKKKDFGSHFSCYRKFFFFAYNVCDDVVIYSAFRIQFHFIYVPIRVYTAVYIFVLNLCGNVITIFLYMYRSWSNLYVLFFLPISRAISLSKVFSKHAFYSLFRSQSEFAQARGIFRDCFSLSD